MCEPRLIHITNIELRCRNIGFFPLKYMGLFCGKIGLFCNRNVYSAAHLRVSHALFMCMWLIHIHVNHLYIFLSFFFSCDWFAYKWLIHIRPHMWFIHIHFILRSWVGESAPLQWVTLCRSVCVCVAVCVHVRPRVCVYVPLFIVDAHRAICFAVCCSMIHYVAVC